MSIWEAIKKGFSINRRLISTYIYDIIFYAALILGFIGWVFILKAVTAGAGDINLSAFMSEDVNAINLNAKLLEILFAKMIGAIAIFLAYWVLIFTFFKGLIWTKLLEKSLNARYFWKSLVINSIEGLVFLVLFIYFIISLKNNILALVSFIIFIHLNSMGYYFFTKENKISRSIIKGLKVTFTKPIYLFYYMIMALVFAGVLVIMSIINAAIPSPVSWGLLVLVLVFVFAIFRNYFIKVMESIENAR